MVFTPARKKISLHDPQISSCPRMTDTQLLLPNGYVNVKENVKKKYEILCIHKLFCDNNILAVS